MKHLNDNVLCAIDIATTGKLPGFHDLIEVSIVPTHGFEINKKILPFNMTIMPKRPENLGSINIRARSLVIKQNTTGAIDPYTAVTMFEHWYKKLELRTRKHIVPLAFAWHLQAPFLIDWFSSSDEGDIYFYDYFDRLYHRDILAVANYWNDVAYCKSEHFPFTKQRLHLLAIKMGVPWVHPSTTLSRCFTIIEIYKKLMDLKLPAGIDLPFNYPIPIDYSRDDPDEVDELDE